MGCGASKENGVVHVDDSVHFMIARDQKRLAKQGRNTDVHYKPRATHPAVLSAATEQEQPATQGDDCTDPAAIADAENDKKETETILYHAAHHGVMIDPRDITLSQCENSEDATKE